jgi:hypothetical protein
MIVRDRSHGYHWMRFIRARHLRVARGVDMSTELGKHLPGDEIEDTCYIIN